MATGLGMHRDGDDGVVGVRLGDVDIGIERLVAKDLLRARIEEIASYVRLRVPAPVRVDDVDLGRAAGEEAIDDGVEIRGKHLLSFGILLGMAEQERAPVVLPRESLHVVVDEDAYWRARRAPRSRSECRGAGRHEEERKRSREV